ncbi:MAG: NAD(P)/FAD-dependent oxidoreductase [Actinomycetota bacterium]|nr:NAD(P)/FAD-dependent oxidoreductase [Actinomycetota bacterium]
MAAAHELRNVLANDEITLIASGDRFYMGFAKLWDLAGVRPLSEGTAKLADLSRRGIVFRQAEITGIDPEDRHVETSHGGLNADAIVVALGADPSPTHSSMLAGDGAFDLYDGRDLPGIREALGQIKDGSILISILGAPFKCPPAPFEAALIVDELLRRKGVRDHVRVAISTPAPMTLPAAGPDASQYVAGHLGDRGIQLLTKHKVTGIDGGRRVARFENGSEFEFTIFLGVPASVVPAVVRASGLAGPSGWIEPDPHTLGTSFNRVYAVGDCTAIPTGTGQLPKAGVFAAEEGKVAARNIASDLGKGEPSTFDGRGFCFLELPGRRVAYVEGNWYAEGGPDVHLTEADEEQFRRKQEYERSRLEEWFGA